MFEFLMVVYGPDDAQPRVLAILRNQDLEACIERVDRLATKRGPPDTSIKLVCRAAPVWPVRVWPVALDEPSWLYVKTAASKSGQIEPKGGHVGQKLAPNRPQFPKPDLTRQDIVSTAITPHFNVFN